MMVMNKMPDGTPWRQGMIAVDVTTGLYTFQALSDGADAPVPLQRGLLHRFQPDARGRGLPGAPS